MYICLTDPEVQLFEQLAHVEHHVPLVQRFNDKKGKQQTSVIAKFLLRGLLNYGFVYA